MAAGSALHRAAVVAAITSAAAAASKPACPGELKIAGFGEPVSIVPTGWKSAYGAEEVQVLNGVEIVSHMSSRAYFASVCNAGAYNNTEYTRMPLLGKTLRYTIDLKDAGCGCNAALYLTSMGHNKHQSECFDYYCDANNVCGQTCAEIDIQEANQHAFHATLHGAMDAFGTAAGLGGGGPGWNGPRDFGPDDYSPGAKCIDSSSPYVVAVSFPVDDSGALVAMWVSLIQEKEGADSCKITLKLDHYELMSEMSKELKRGMTPIVSYWADDDMLWLDGLGDDHKGQCSKDSKQKCAESVRFYNFSLADVSEDDMPAASESPAPTNQPSDDWWNQPWGSGSQEQSTTAAMGSLDWSGDTEKSGEGAAQQLGSSDWNQGDDSSGNAWSKGGGDGDGGSSSKSDSVVVEEGKCVEFDNWRKAVVGGRAVHVDLGQRPYGFKMPWEECRRLCAADVVCKQVVFYKPTGACFGMKEAQGRDQDDMGGSNYDFISAQCNEACAEFNNWRKSEAGEHLSFGSHEFGDVAEDWPTCRDRCVKTPDCKQVVYYRPERKCYGMSAQSDIDQDDLGGNNPDFVSAHCRQGIPPSKLADDDDGLGIVSGISNMNTHITMQKHTGFSEPTTPSRARSWFLVGSSLAVCVVLVACGVLLAGATRRRNLSSQVPMSAALPRVPRRGGATEPEHGLMRARPSSEHLLQLGGATELQLAASLPQATPAVEVQKRFL